MPEAKKPAPPKRYFRPYGVDALGEIVKSDKSGITVRYMHDPQRTWHFSNGEAEKVGRIVTAGELA